MLPKDDGDAATSTGSASDVAGRQSLSVNNFFRTRRAGGRSRSSFLRSADE